MEKFAGGKVSVWSLDRTRRNETNERITMVHCTVHFTWWAEIEMRSTEMLWEGCDTSRFPFSGPPTYPTFPKVKSESRGRTGSHTVAHWRSGRSERVGFAGERRCGARRGRQAGRPFFIEGRSLSSQASGTRRSIATSGFASRRALGAHS